MPRSLRHGVVCAFVGLLLFAGAQPFRATPEAQNPDTMKELLLEVRGLRAAMEQLASAGPRVQLMLGRLQLQEQRINDQARKLDGLRAQLAKAQEEETNTRATIQRYEEFVRNNPSSPERTDLENDLPVLRKSLVRLSANTQRLLAEEATMTSAIGVEQNRWSDINRTLDELDRTLGRR